MTLDPKDWTDIRTLGHHMLDDMFDFLADIKHAPLWRSPDTAKSLLLSALPEKASSLNAVYEQFQNTILPYGSGNLHPGFMGWVQGAGTPVGMLAEMLAAGLNANVGGRHHMAIAIEQQVVEWMRALFGFPEHAQGLFVTGASQANFVATLLARNRALGLATRNNGVAAAGKTLVAYASCEAHGCIPRALDMAGIGSDQLRKIKIDDQYRIDLTDLKAAIAADRKAGLTPFMLIGSAGTVNVGSVDDLDALADIAEAESLSFHVDGAIGAVAMMSRQLKPLMAGIERSDSIAFDFHKWAHVPYDAGFILVRDGAAQKAAFASDAAYLTRAEKGLAAGDWWPCDYGPDLARGFRALKTWFTLKAYGTDALGASMVENCRLAQSLADKIVAQPELELRAPVALNIVCFSYVHTHADILNKYIVEELHMAAEVAPSLTILNGRPVIRAAILNHRTTMNNIDTLVNSVLALGRTLSAAL